MSSPSTSVRLVAEPRSSFGKGAARRLRREGKVPAVVYGSGGLLQHIAVDGHDLALALKRPGVVFEIEIDGTLTLTAPRDVQREPVKQVLEHLDLVVINRAEADERAAVAEAMADAAAAAIEAGLDPVAVAEAAAAAVEAGESAADAVAHAVSDAEHDLEANIEANAAAEAAEAAEASGATASGDENA